MSTATGDSTISVPAIEIGRVDLIIRGTSELVMHAWSEKAKSEIRDKQQGAARNKKEPKNPEAEYEAAFHRLPDGRPAFPAVGFKAAAVSAARQVEGLTMTFLRGVFHVDVELIPIEGDPYMREDMVRVGGKGPGTGVADIRYRPGFPEWSAVLPVSFNRKAITVEQLVHLFNVAGFAVGVGEWRPEKNGSWGRFVVDGVEEVE